MSRHSFRLLTQCWDSQRRELKVWFESLTRRHPVPELGLPGFSFGRVRQVPHRALVNRAARRLGHPASIPRAIMSRSPEALAFGSRRHFIPASLSLPLCGCLLNRSRDCSRSRVPPRFPRRRYADAPAAASFSCLRFASARSCRSPVGGAKTAIIIEPDFRLGPGCGSGAFRRIEPDLWIINGPYRVKWIIYKTIRLTGLNGVSYKSAT